MNILKYKGYEGKVDVDVARGACRGKILFIDDLITFESSVISDIQKEFEAAVDDYIETCTELGRAPQSPLKGQFNVRVPATLHKAAALKAISEDISLNEVVVRALDAFINGRSNETVPTT